MRGDEFDLAEHRQNFSFFYDRAHEIERYIGDLVFRLRGPVIDLLQAPRDKRGALTDIPEYVVTNIEAGFTLAVKALLECPTYQGLSEDEKETFKRELFGIPFKE